MAGRSTEPVARNPPTPAARAGRVSFLDVPHGFDEATNASMWKTTEEKVAELMTLPADRPSLYRRAAFVLSPAVLEGVVFDP